MCGIAGFSLSPGAAVDRTLAAQALLAGIAERGADAVGYAHRGGSGQIRVTKLRGGASALLDELDVPADASHALIHVRDFTKGHPGIEANNHPIRHGTVVGHPQRHHRERRRAPRPLRDRTRRTADDRRLGGDLRDHGAPRARSSRPFRDARRHGGGMDRRARRCDALPRARPASTAVARSSRPRPLLRFDAAGAHDRRSGPEDAAWTSPSFARGGSSTSSAGRVVRERRFRPDRHYRESGYLPPVRAPREAVSLPPERSPSSPQSAPPSDPSGRTSTPSSRSRSRTRNWNAVQAPRGTSSSR